MSQTRTIAIDVAAVLLIVFCAGVSGQAAAPGPSGAGLDCTTALTNASDCLSYVLAGSTLTKPDKGCCGELAGLVESNPICLCYLAAGQNSFGIQLDTSRALKLPSVCSVTTPPVSLCSAVGIPVAAPMSGGGMVSTDAPTSTDSFISPSAYPSSTSLSPGSGPIAAVPSPSSTTSGASSIAGHSLALFFGVVIALVFMVSF